MTLTVDATEPQTMRQTIPVRLRSLRQGRGWTLRQLQEEIHRRTDRLISISYLSEVERLIAPSPPLDTLADIGHAYGMSAVEVLQGTGYASQNQSQEDQAFDRYFEGVSQTAAMLLVLLPRFQEGLAQLREMELYRRSVLAHQEGREE